MAALSDRSPERRRSGAAVASARLATVGGMRTGSSPAGQLLGLAVLAVVALGACAGDDDATTEPSVSATLLSAPPGSPGSTSTPGAASSSSSTVAGSIRDPATTGGSTGTASTAVQTAPTSPPTEPTGVPGGASDNPMCRDYATVVGSQSVLTIAGAFGDLDPAALARLELIAAPAVVDAASALASEWPAELAAEQSTVQQSVIAPILDRAVRALAAVDDAGLDRASLVSAWQSVLAGYDPSRPDVSVADVPPQVDAALTTAAEAYAATETRYDLDPSVLRTAPTPLTTAYLFDRCPELSHLIAGDAD
jgi:hypothetical protein